MKAVIYGAGNIGRGFIAQLFSESGYDITFIDIDDEIINLINTQKKYPIVLSDTGKSSVPEEQTEVWIEKIHALNANERGSVIKAISEADIMATSVGVNAMKFTYESIAAGIDKRFDTGNFHPLNIIVCENLIGAAKVMCDGISACINGEYKNLAKKKIGFVDASVGRTVPNRTNPDDKLRIVTESYSALPVDKDAFIGEPPYIRNMILYSPFDFYVKRKLFIHNMGHAACAYFGSLFGYEYIYDSIDNPFIKLMTLRAMQRTAIALHKKYAADYRESNIPDELNRYIENLLYRFRNKTLGDTIARVGADIRRKLAPNDRLTGAYSLCREQKISVCYSLLAIAAALNFRNEPSDADAILDADVMGTDIAVVRRYNKFIKSVKSPAELLDFIENEENHLNGAYE